MLCSGIIQGMQTVLANNKKMRSRHQNIFDHNHDLKIHMKIMDRGKKLTDSEREIIRKKVKKQQRVQLIMTLAVLIINTTAVGYVIYVIM